MMSINTAIRSSVLGVAVAVSGFMLAMAPAARAHHSIALEFDMNRELTVTGTITRMDWRNPHGWLYIDVTDENGEVQPWAVEFTAANALYRRGWRKEDLPVGETVTITGFAARDDSNTLGALNVELSDGRKLFAGSGNR
jgi:DNA/RNA endonuclease YhcR with UshA esterase domain